MDPYDHRIVGVTISHAVNTSCHTWTEVLWISNKRFPVSQFIIGLGKWLARNGPQTIIQPMINPFKDTCLLVWRYIRTKTFHITNSTVCSPACVCSQQSKHRRLLTLCSRSSVDSPHKASVLWKALPYDDVIMRDLYDTAQTTNHYYLMANDGLAQGRMLLPCVRLIVQIFWLGHHRLI